MTDELYLIAVSGEPKARLEAWRADFIRCEAEWHSYARMLGAVRVFSFPFQKPSGFEFRGQPPEGWTKPDSRGRSRPKRRNAAVIADMNALHSPQNIDDLCRELGLPLHIICAYSDGREELQRIGNWHYNAYSPCWTRNGPVILKTSDFRAAAAKCREDGGNVSFYHGDGSIPAGFETASKARVDFMFAEAAMKAEPRDD